MVYTINFVVMKIHPPPRYLIS